MNPPTPTPAGDPANPRSAVDRPQVTPLWLLILADFERAAVRTN